MPTPEILTVHDQIVWSYANLARAHAALEDGRTRYVRLDHIIRSRLFGGLRDGRMSIRSLYDDERLKILSGGQCVYCGATEEISIDHLIPRIKGGGDDGANLAPACRRCNSSKQGRDLLAWYAGRGDFPPLMLLRRYLKLVYEYCDKLSIMDCPLHSPDLAGLPFDIYALPLSYPPLADMRL